MLSFPRKSSRASSKKDRPAVQTIPTGRPGLAVDTSFTRHRGKAPEQVFPQQRKPREVRFVNLTDLQPLDSGPLSVTAKSSGGTKQQLNSSVYVPLTKQHAVVQQAPPYPDAPRDGLGIYHQTKPISSPDSQNFLGVSKSLLHQRVKGLRPSPLELSSEISPSDRVIPIGIQVSSSSLSESRSGPAKKGLDGRDNEPHLVSKELPTPTIVITPAKEDFDSRFTASPEEIQIKNYPRPTSSVYSGYMNNTVIGYTPPVPPLPLFVAQSNATLRQTNLDLPQAGDDENAQSSIRPASRSKSALALQTVFEEDNKSNTNSVAARNSRRLTAVSTTSRRSKGWWNVITSPFSPSGMYPVSYLRSPPVDDDLGEEREPILSGASGMARSKLSNIIIQSREADEVDLRSAPAASKTFNIDQDTKSKPPKTIPQRSDTCPGALDRGNADKVNIYRQPSQGTARSYYNLRDSGAGRPKSVVVDKELEGWSPSQSVYRASKPVFGLRDSGFYAVPETGEAASYYDSNKRFPSVASDAFLDRDIGWDPRNSVAHPVEEKNGGSRDIAIATDGADEGPSPSASESTLEDPPYPVNSNPFGDANAVGYDDLGQEGPKGYGPDLTPSSGDASAFKDFSATHPAATFLEMPEDNVSYTNPGPETERNGSQDVFSPLLETPLVEEARTATFIGPEAHREVEVPSAKLRRSPPAYGGGLGDATMASQEADFGYARSFQSMSDDSESDWEQDGPSRNEPAGFGYLAENRGRMNDSADAFSEKAIVSTSNVDRTADEPSKTPWYRRFARLIIAITVILLLGLLALLLVLLVPWHHNSQPVEAAWLNLTGFPPLPTGVVTVINPKAVQEVDGCTSQQGLWSCGLPAPDATTTTTSNDTPNFRFQILFRNNILPSNETAIQPSNMTLSRRSMGHASGANDVVRRGVFTSPLWNSSPAPPSQQDQDFLGQTTDNITAPYNGEQTPFYITLLNASALTDTPSSKLRKRGGFHYPYPTPSNTTSFSPSSSHYPQTTNASSPSTDSSIPNIPHAATTKGGYPAPASLYPFAYAQPLRLYNRGLSSEHYGFYTYFDRTIYISDSGNATGGGVSNSTSSSIVTSNTPLDSSTAVCTWSETRFLVQIWTRKSDVGALNATANNDIPLAESTANDMEAPGSFPYSVTVSLDRHGGDAGEKGVYCHSLDTDHQVLQDVRTWVVENRSFGGGLVNPGPVPTNNGNVLSKGSVGSEGGIDGGTGGCSCKWQNW